jgi:hypothetical protein
VDIENEREEIANKNRVDFRRKSREPEVSAVGKRGGDTRGEIGGTPSDVAHNPPIVKVIPLAGPPHPAHQKPFRQKGKNNIRSTCIPNKK